LVEKSAEEVPLGRASEKAGLSRGKGPTSSADSSTESLNLPFLTEPTQVRAVLGAATPRAAPPARVALVQRLQSVAGNLAVTALLSNAANVQRQGGAAATATPTSLDAQYVAAIAQGRWGQAATYLSGFDNTQIMARLRRLSNAQRVDLYEGAEAALGYPRRMPIIVGLRFLGVAVGHEAPSAEENVGGWEYGVRGAYDYRITPVSIEVRVKINFVPDAGVTPPVSTWFGYITSMWNHYTAVDQSNRSQKRRIHFTPIQGTGMHTVNVHAGDQRADAANLYVGDSRASSTIPHEFGHLVGLEDEYERTAGDYARVTGEALPAGDTSQAPAARTIATEMHEALFKEEHWYERHRTAVRRRKEAVNAVFSNHSLPKNYSNAITRQVATMYRVIYSGSLNGHIVDQIDADSGDSHFHDWREGVVGAFEYTNASIMGNVQLAAAGTPEHDHPVQPRHVRHFARLVQDFLGRGNWQPEADH